MHRDISSSNIMLDADGYGIMNDWDHCIHLHPDDVGMSRRTVSFGVAYGHHLLTTPTAELLTPC